MIDEDGRLDDRKGTRRPTAALGTVSRVSRANMGFMLLCGLLGCNDDQDKGDHIGTMALGDSIYVERFYSSAGVHGGGTQMYFVTDSSTYRFRIGSCDDKQYLTMKVDGSTLVVQKHSRRNLRNGESKIIGTETFDLPPTAAGVPGPEGS
jgi:hypothetical protein